MDSAVWSMPRNGDGGTALVPDRAALAGREPQQLQRVAIRIAELERPHGAVRGRQQLRAAIGDRLPPGAADEVGVRGIDVVHHYRQMLEPQIVASAVRRVWPAWHGASHQRDLLGAEPHHDLLGITQPERGQRRLIGGGHARQRGNPVASR